MAAPSTAELFGALAASFEAGLTPSEACSTIARAGPDAARLARRLSEATEGRSFTAALDAVIGLDADERVVLGLGEETGRFAAALGWASRRQDERRARRRALLGVLVGPLLLTLITVLTEPLPAIILGAGTIWPTVRMLAWWIGGAIALWIMGSRALARPAVDQVVRRIGRRLPIASRLFRIADEARVAALLHTFGTGRELGETVRALRALMPDYAPAIERAAAEPLAVLSSLSESLALALAVGQRSGDLSGRVEAVRVAFSERLTARLKLIVRVLAWSLVLVTSLHAGRKLMTMQLPGLDGLKGLDTAVPGMDELERELENAGK